MWGGVTFLDSDDYLHRDALRELCCAMEATDADMVVMRSIRFIGPFSKKSLYQLPEQTIEHDELMEKYYIQFFGSNVFPVSMWGKLYKISTLKAADLKPTGFKRSEDLFFNLGLFPKLRKVTIIDYEGYCYRAGGSTSKYNPCLYSDYRLMNKLKFEEAQNHNYSKAYPYLAAELRNYFISYLIQEIKYNKMDRKSAIGLIEERLQDEYLRQILSQPYAPSTDLDKNILAGNAGEIYTIISKRTTKTIKGRLLEYVVRIMSIMSL